MLLFKRFKMEGKHPFPCSEKSTISQLPSQFMENWCYDKPTVYGFAKHWETGEPLPEEKFKKLCEQKVFNAGMMACRQLYFGQMDMELHCNFDPEAGEKGEGKTIFDVQQEVASKYVPHAMPLDEDRFLCAFGHIFAVGYLAGYYLYKWAEVSHPNTLSAQIEWLGLTLSTRFYLDAIS